MASKESHTNVAAIFGVTGLVGKELARKLTSKPEWKVYGIARKPDRVTPTFNRSNFYFIQCDLQDPFESRQKLSSLEDVTHMFWVTWASQSLYDSQKCCEQNKAMMSNALDAVLLTAEKSLKHVSLQTGLSHYVPSQGPFDGYDEDQVWFFDEESRRVSNEKANFYYVLEDLLKERLENKVSWSVHRPGLLFGSSCRTFFNFMGCLCVYGTICGHLDLPFVFGGSKKRWEESSIDGSDSRLVAEQHIWAATNEDLYSTEGQPFNAINGPGFTWKEIWPTLGKRFGARVPDDDDDVFSEEFRYSEAMADKGKVWEEIVEKEGLVKTKMEDLANWQFMDILFRCPVRLLASRDKADRLGFTLRYKTLDSILYFIEAMRNDKLIPKPE